MSSDSPAPAPAPAPRPGPSDRAAAVERRLKQQQLEQQQLEQASTTPAPPEAQFSGADYELKIKLRRMIDPGILRPNPEKQAMTSIRLLIKLADNILSDPSNDKYHSFKPTNTIIQRDLIAPKGTVEYAREMGFSPEVNEYQPVYKFNPKRLHQLRIAADLLRDTLAIITEKEERAARSKKNEKAAKEAAAEKVRIAFEEDRKRKQENDVLEKERRAARLALAAQRAERERLEKEDADMDDESDEDDEDADRMPGPGQRLGDTPVTTQETDMPNDQTDE